MSRDLSPRARKRRGRGFWSLSQKEAGIPHLGHIGWDKVLVFGELQLCGGMGIQKVGVRSNGFRCGELWLNAWAPWGWTGA